MTYTLYQIQLETRDGIYCFEIGTNDFDAVDWAEAYMANKDIFGPFHVGGHSSIGTTGQEGVVSFKIGG